VIKTNFFIFLLWPFLSLSQDLKATSFVFCLKKTATGQQARSIRIHKWSDNKKCVVIYSVFGKDQVVFENKWSSLCAHKARNIIKELKKSLWQCDPENKQTEVFYSTTQ